MPVAVAMFTASVGTAVANDADKKKTVFKSNSAFNTHCTARKLTKNVATFLLANFAIKINPAEMARPANSVNGIPDQAANEKIGLMNPKIIVSAKMSTPHASNTTLDLTDCRIATSNNAPKAIDPKYPALEMKSCEMSPPCVV